MGFYPKVGRASDKAKAVALAAGTGAAVCLAAGAVAGGVSALLEQRHVRVYPHAKYGPLLVYQVRDEEGAWVRVMRQGGVYQSATYVDERRFSLVFEYYRAFDHVFDTESLSNPMRRMLMLGGGGFAYPKHVVSSFPDASIDVCEADPLVIRVARKHFFVDDLIQQYDTERSRRLNIIAARAQDYLAGACGMDYDVIINDCFQGAQAAGGHDDAETCLAVKRALRPGGVYALNVVDEEGAYGPAVEAAVEAASAAFSCVYVIPCPDSRFSESCNVMVAACDSACSFGGVEWARCEA